VNSPFICSNIPVATAFEYIALTWYDIPELMIPIMIFLIEGRYYLSWSFTVASMTYLIVAEYLCQKWPWKCSVFRNHNSFIIHSWLITGFVKRVALWLPKHLRSPPVLSGLRVAQSLIFFVVFGDRCLSFFFRLFCFLSFLDIRIMIAPFGIDKLSLSKFYLWKYQSKWMALTSLANLSSLL